MPKPSYLLGAALAILVVFASPTAAQQSRVFATSTTYDGNLGGPSGAAQKCADRAAAGGLGGSWVAFLSTSAVDAKDRLPPGSGPVCAGRQHWRGDRQRHPGST